MTLDFMVSVLACYEHDGMSIQLGTLRSARNQCWTGASLP